MGSDTLRTALHTLGEQAQIVAVHLAAAPNPITDPGTEAPPGSGGVLTILKWFLWLAFVACVAGVAKAGGLLAWVGGGRGSASAGEHGMGFVIALIGSIITGSAAAIVTAVTA